MKPTRRENVASFPEPSDAPRWAARAERATKARDYGRGRAAGPAAEIAHVSASAPVDVPRVLSRRQYLDLIQGGD
jgi:hypothetical protein